MPFIIMKEYFNIIAIAAGIINVVNNIKLTIKLIYSSILFKKTI